MDVLAKLGAKMSAERDPVAGWRPCRCSEPGIVRRDRHDIRCVEGMRKRLQSKGVKFRESIVPRTGDTQFFLYDPDGVGVELNFPKT